MMEHPGFTSEDSLSVRASDDERDQAAEVVRRGYEEGRLSRGELEERVAAAYRAMGREELEDLVGDLPGRTLPKPKEGRPSRSTLVLEPYDRRELGCSDRCLILALMFAFPPAGIAYWALSMRGRRRVAG